MTGNPELWTHIVMERGKRCVKVAQNVRGGFQCHRVQIGFLDFCPAVRRLIVGAAATLTDGQSTIDRQSAPTLHCVRGSFVALSAVSSLTIVDTRVGSFCHWVCIGLDSRWRHVGLPRVLSRKIMWKSIILSG